MDKAIDKAQSTFESRNWGFDKCTSRSAQKACKLSKVRESLKFGFKGGWVTVHGNNEKTIFEMFEEAKKHKFASNEEIEEIFAIYVDGKRVF